MADDFEDFGPNLVTPEDVERFRTGLTKRPVSHSVSADPTDEPVADAPVAEPVRRKPARSAGPRPRRRLPLSAVGATLVLVAAVWLSTGFYKVEPDQMGLVMRFGQWTVTAGPGLNYHWPYPIETVLLPRVTQLSQQHLGTGSVTQMLTGDENIVEASASVSWRISDPAKYLFNVLDPEETVQVAGESAVREVIALNPIQSGLSDQRQKISDDIQTLLQKQLDAYDMGVKITQVQLERVDPPTAVIDAFNDVQRARADQERAQNEAEAYSNDALPRARGDAARINEEADAYKALVLNQAEGDARRFLALHDSYLKARDITARRLYLETMEDVLKGAGKVLIDPSAHGGSSIVPLLSLGTQGTATPQGSAVPQKSQP